MIILGVDPSATQTGLAVVPVPSKDSEVVCASFTAEGDSPEAKADDWGRKFADALTVWKPDYVAHEIAMRFIAGYAKKGRPDLAGGTAGFWTPNSDQLILPEIQGHLRQACADRGIPFEGVPVKTWRAAMYGTGGGKLDTEAAKAYARKYCQLVGIDAKNHNEAEAAIIGQWAARCSQPFKLMRLESRHG